MLATSCNKNTSTTVLSTYNFQDSGDGCANFIVYKHDNDANATLSVSGMRDVLNLSSEALSFNLPHDGLTIQLNQFDGPIGYYYCDDVAGDEAMIITTSSPISGTAEITITADSTYVSTYEIHYELSVFLKNLEFEVPDSDETIVIEDISFEGINVGWLPG